MRSLPEVATVPAAASRSPGKVLILGTMTSPSGAPIAALRLAAGLAASGWATRAAFLYDREAMNRADHPFIVLASHPPRGPLDHIRIARRLVALLRRERPDVIVGFLPLASVLGAAAARLCGVRARIVSHRVPRQTYSGMMRRLDTLAARSGCYTDVIAVSRSVADSCSGYPEWLRRRTAVVYNGLKDWRPSPLSRAAARAWLGLPEGGFVIAAVGRLDPQKNYPLLIDAVAMTAPGSVLAIAGDGSLHDAIAANIAARGLGERVRLLGALAREEVPHLLAAADLFAQPSLFEGQSNALLEALHVGLPCLVSDVPEQVETVQESVDAVAGAILPLGEPHAWAEAISRFATDADRLAEARDVAWRQARNFSFERMMTGFEAILRGAAGRRSG